MAIVYKLESIKNLVDVVTPMMREHYLETSYFAEKYLFQPNFNQYIEMERNEQFKFFTVYNDYELIGYAGYWLNRHQHCDAVIAYQDGIYIKPQYRGLGYSKNLINFIDKILCSFCVEQVVVNVPAKNDFSLMYLKQGYSLVDKTLIKGI